MNIATLSMTDEEYVEYRRQKREIDKLIRRTPRKKCKTSLAEEMKHWGDIDDDKPLRSYL